MRRSAHPVGDPVVLPVVGKWFYPVAVVSVAGCIGAHLYAMHKVNYVGYSDIIPNIQILAQRFLHGKTVYALEAWQETTYGRYYPFYLPMHWLPFLGSEYIHMDPRYVTITVFVLAAGYVLVRTRKSVDPRMQMAIPLLLLLTSAIMAKKANFVAGVTIEPMIIGFYLLFLTSLNQKNFLFSGLAFTLCLLSRYYIAVWLPLWLFVILASGEGKYAIRTILVVAAGVGLLYVVPFLSHNWSTLFSIGNGYDLAIISEWTKNMNKDGLPYHLFRGHGFAYLFYSHYAAVDKTKGFYLLKKVLMVVPLLSTLVMAAWYYPRRRNINMRIFLMASFKVYLTIFLNFMIVPYIYLFATSVFLSIGILAELNRYGSNEDIYKK